MIGGGPQNGFRSMTGARPPQPHRLWPLAGLAVLMLAPLPWAVAAVAAFALGHLAVAAKRRHRRSRVADASRAHGATVIGSDRAGRHLLLGDDQLSAHGLIVGASGAGKTTTLLSILTDHIERGRPVVAIDMKGSPSFEHALASAAAAAGRSFRVWTPDGPDFWNPLQHGNATELKDKLIATERFTEPHYKRAAERYVQIVLKTLHELHPDRPATLDEVVDAMDPKRLTALVRRGPRGGAAAVHDYVAGLTPDQVSAIRGLGTRLAIVSESHTGRFLSPPRGDIASSGAAPIDLRRALDGGEVVLFSLNSSTYGQLSAQLGALAIQDLIAAVGGRFADRDGPHPQATIAIDEFSALGGDNVLSLLARGRGAGVSVLLATQELADLDRAAHGFRDQVLGNTAVKIIHRQDVPSSASTVAQMAGTVKRWETSEQVGAWGGYAGRGTRREVEQFAVHPNEIKGLRTGEAVLIVKQPRAGVATVRVAPPRTRPVGREAGRSRERGRAGAWLRVLLAVRRAGWAARAGRVPLVRPVTALTGTRPRSAPTLPLHCQRRAARPRNETQAAPGVTRKASNTASMFRRRLIAWSSARVSPTSTTNRFLTIGWLTVQRASRMLIPASANVRDMSSSRRWRSQPSTSISTRNEVSASPSHATGVNRSGSFFSTATLGQSSRWIVIPRPSEM